MGSIDHGCLVRIGARGPAEEIIDEKRDLHAVFLSGLRDRPEDTSIRPGSQHARPSTGRIR
jgi:hypothetical protein